MSIFRFVILAIVMFLILRDPKRFAAWFTRRLVFAIVLGAIILIGGALFGGCS